MKRSRPSRAVLELRADVVESQFFGWCGVGVPSCCTGIAMHAHHKLRRSQGGQDTWENLLAVCPACHDWIHHNTGESYERGWLIRSGGTA